jgi:hypothetical protein
MPTSNSAPRKVTLTPDAPTKNPTAVDYDSAYTDAFEQWDAKNLAKNVAGESNARKTNLEIGHNVDDGPNFMKSVYSNYHSYKQGEVARLNPEKIKDLRAHHFQLGQMNFGPHVKNTSTEATATYLPKAQMFDLKAEFEKTKEQSRASVSKIFFLSIEQIIRR